MSIYFRTAVKNSLTFGLFSALWPVSLIRYAGGRDMGNNQHRQGPRPLWLLFFCRYFVPCSVVTVSPVHTSREPPHGHRRTPHTYTHVHRCTHATPSVNF